MIIEKKWHKVINLYFIFCLPCISVKFLLITNLTHFFNIFISLLYMFRATQCSSSGESIYQYIIWYVLICVGDCLVCRYQMLYQYIIWYVLLCVGDCLVCRYQMLYQHIIWYVLLCVGDCLVCRDQMMY